MAKAKSKAAIMLADGFGGMKEVPDRRFESMVDWPLRFEVPKELADTWLRYFHAECDRRAWSSGGIQQLDARENSGSLTVNTGGSTQPQLAVVWERRRGGPLKVRACSAGVAEFALSQAEELFAVVNEKCRTGYTERLYCRAQLCYDGLPWRGELWLDDTLRLGPPATDDEAALLGPRVILVDMLVDCAGRSDAPYALNLKIRELSAFLSVVLGTLVRPPEHGRRWTFSAGADDCAVRQLGYFEPGNAQEMPPKRVDS